MELKIEPIFPTSSRIHCIEFCFDHKSRDVQFIVPAECKYLSALSSCQMMYCLWMSARMPALITMCKSKEKKYKKNKKMVDTVKFNLIK